MIEKLWFFELTQAEAMPLMSKTRSKMGVKNVDLDSRTLELLTEIEKEKTQEMKERQKAKEEGRDPGPMTKFIYYPDDWGQYTFGVTTKEHGTKAKVSI